jgi:type IV secretion system protein VirB3
MSLVKIPIHASLIRPLLIAGCERKLVLLNCVTAFALIFGIGNVMSVVVGLFLAIGLHWGLVQIAKKDPQFSDVYSRHIRYQTFYPAKSHHSAPSQIIRYH